MSDDDGRSGFVDALEVGDEGANVLVVGAVPAPHHRQVCRQTMTTTTESRRLLVLCDGGTEALDDYLDRSVPRDPEHLQVIEHDARGPSATDGGGGYGPRLDEAVLERTPDDDLGVLGATISEAVDSFEAIAGGLGPGDLRVCFDSLEALVAEHGETDVFGFLHILTERLDRASSLSAFHLAVAPNDPTVTMLGSLFDAVVVLRAEGGDLQFRIEGRDEGWQSLDDE